jgi:hypothetical protein
MSLKQTRKERTWPLIVVASRFVLALSCAVVSGRRFGPLALWLLGSEAEPPVRDLEEPSPSRRYAHRGRRQSWSRKTLSLRGKTAFQRGKAGAAGQRQDLLRT